MARTMTTGPRPLVYGAWVLATMVAPVPAQTRAPLNSRVLAAQYNDAYAKKDWARAIEIGLQWTKLKSKDPVAAYNLACAYALNGDKANAVKWLRASVANGFNDATHLQQDADLDAIRHEPGYREALDVAVKAEEGYLEAARKSKPLVILPAGHEPAAPAPMIVVLHGYGSNAEDIVTPWKPVADRLGAVLVAPRAVRWVNDSGYSWSNVDEADIIVTNAIDRVMGRHAIDPKRVVLSGFSQGAYMAFNLGLRHPETFCGVIPMAGRFDPTVAAMADVPQSKRPRFYLMIGEADRPESIEQNRRAAENLKAAGVGVVLVTYPGLGHRFPPDTTAELNKAVTFVLGGG